jgi:ectoine hydroxylase-related dioxygenase (phytanoyl-CoA dioxygenase family)
MHTQLNYFSEEACDIAEFAALIEQETQAASVPFAADIARQIPIYDCAELAAALQTQRSALMSEWAWVLAQGPGVLVLKRAFADTTPLDEANEVFRQVIEYERANKVGADHFAQGGANDRIWNSLQKLCEAAPEVFARCYANPMIDAVAEAWLGPGYQMTAQVNVVRPGGAAQQAHRDYHLGFQTAESAARFPAHAHELSALMTLQGAVAHSDMPVASGPTKLLPFSQLYRQGYMAWRRADFRELFESRFVQLPLAKGDAVFFSPALFHAAGDNRTPDVQRIANLLQISSPFGRAMESVDRVEMCKLLYPALQKLQLGAAQTDAAIAACAEGYPFPTNLDSDPPQYGLAPQTQADLFRSALAEGASPEAFATALHAREATRKA